MTRYTKERNAVKEQVTDTQKQHLQALTNNIKKLDSFKLLEWNWNDNEAAPFEPAFIDHIKTIVAQLLVQPQIFPTSRNSIQLEYDKPNGDSVELEIYPDGLIESVQFLQTGIVEKNLSKTDLPTLIEAFYAD